MLYWIRKYNSIVKSTGFQINFLCIDLDQVNHLKDLRGDIQKFGNFTCPTDDTGGASNKSSQLPPLTKNSLLAIPWRRRQFR